MGEVKVWGKGQKKKKTLTSNFFQCTRIKIVQYSLDSLILYTLHASHFYNNKSQLISKS